MMSLITPTRNRPEAFALLERWVARQIFRKPVQWIVVNDGTVAYDYHAGQEVVLRDPSQDTGHSLCHNLLAAIPRVRGDRVLILEDDDWYAPRYFKTMYKLLEGAELVGSQPARWYNVTNRSWGHRKCAQHASLGQTGMRATALVALQRHAAAGRTTVDLRLWHQWTGTKLRVPNADLHVAIKELPGEPGAGGCHRRLGQHDPSYGKLLAWLGADAKAYIELHRGTASKAARQHEPADIDAAAPVIFVGPKGLGDEVCGYYAACGLADSTGRHVGFACRHEEWFCGVQHPGVVFLPFSNKEVNAALDAANYTAVSRKQHYCDNLAMQLRLRRFAPAASFAPAPTAGLGLAGACNRARRVVILAPFSDWHQRAWPLTNWVALTKCLSDCLVVCVTLPNKAEVLCTAMTNTPALCLWGLTPAQCVGLLLGAACVVANDSGLAHVGGLYNIPTVSVHAGCLLHDFLFDCTTTVTSVTPAGPPAPRAHHNEERLAAVTIDSVHAAIRKAMSDHARDQ